MVQTNQNSLVVPNIRGGNLAIRSVKAGEKESGAYLLATDSNGNQVEVFLSLESTLDASQVLNNIFNDVTAHTLFSKKPRKEVP